MNMFSIITAMPYWMWGIFGYLLYSGYKATKNGLHTLYSLGTGPTLLTLWSLFSGLKLGVWFWVVALVLLGGVVVGFKIMNRLPVSFKSNNLVNLSGSYIPFIASAIFFVIKYGHALLYAYNSPVIHFLITKLLGASFSSLVSGISLGRFVNIVKRYFLSN
ncbi:hypothetical protein Noda2021_04310 [Candidatus Dependentiae bacterium Noda2021]|nr:hypothetical protein Noda2021_04310 [Candidatus Dependentiae bacterium Noda2021]